MLVRGYERLVAVEGSAVFRPWSELKSGLGATLGPTLGWASAECCFVVSQASNVTDELIYADVSLICPWFSKELPIRIDEHIRIDLPVVSCRLQTTLTRLSTCSDRRLLCLRPLGRIYYLLNDALRPSEIWPWVTPNFRQRCATAILSKFQKRPYIHRFNKQATLLFLLLSTSWPSCSQLFLVFRSIFWFKQALVNSIELSHILV